MVEKRFIVSDMSCSSCAMCLEGLEDDLPGVLEVKASYRKQEMLVKFDESKVTVEQIIAAAKDLGYTAELAIGN
jgi:copper chaperone CopZ